MVLISDSEKECICPNIDITTVLGASSKFDINKWKEDKHIRMDKERKCHIYNNHKYCYCGDLDVR